MKKWMCLPLSLFLLSLCPALAVFGFQKVNDYTPGQFTDMPAGNWCADSVRRAYEYGIMDGTTAAPHYNDPYGYFVLKTVSCAGCARATGLCLNILVIPYEHIKGNQWGHQWCRVNVNGTCWICDAYGLYCDPEPAPCQHPYL